MCDAVSIENQFIILNTIAGDMHTNTSNPAYYPI